MKRKSPEERIIEAQTKNAEIYRKWAKEERDPDRKKEWIALAKEAEACAKQFSK